MVMIKSGDRAYNYKTYRINVKTEKELERLKKKMNRTYDGVLKELIEVYQQNENYKSGKLK